MVGFSDGFVVIIQMSSLGGGGGVERLSSCSQRQQLLSRGDKRSSDITNVSKINSRLLLCGTVKAWKGDHMLG